MTYRAASGGSTSTLTATPPVALTNDVISIDVGTTNGTVAAGDHTHGIYQLSSAKDQVNGYAGLDGNGLASVAQLTNVLSVAVPIITVDGTTIVGSSGNPYVMQPGSRIVYVKKGTGSNTSITLPSAPILGQRYEIMDSGDSTLHNITITAPNGMTIENGPNPFLINNNGDSLSFMAINSTTWRLV